MRWRISHYVHDRRLIDLLVILALIVVIISAYGYFEHSTEPAPRSAAFIVPSQSVRW